jgi:uncharacterized protein (DUF1800 family)
MRVPLSLQTTLHNAVSGTLCLLMATQPMLAAAAVPKAPTPSRMTPQQQVLHALNRLTFGPKPGDVARVQAMGLNAWFEQQLNPASIGDNQLDARLSQFPAMQMSESELIRRYPGPGELRQMLKNGTPLPSNPVWHAIYAEYMAFYQMQQAKKAEADSKAGSPEAAMRAAGAGDSAMQQPEKPLAPAEMIPFSTAPAHQENLFPQEKVMAILAMPANQRMQTLLSMPPNDLAKLRQSLTAPELAALADGLPPLDKETLMALPGSLRMIGAEAIESRILRDVYSERQLEAVMTDFWLNHFNVYMKKSQQEPFKIPAYERETIRPHALGRFEDLLVATAMSPAMLTYLDNWRSIGPGSIAADKAKRSQRKGAQASEGLNENYGRELMELHTLGVGGGYTQADVTQVAKVFTGWTIAKPYEGGGFVFDPRRHEPGTKLVLGQKIRENGMHEGLEVLHLLAASPATARFISSKLAVRFVSDDPPPSLIDKMTNSFLASGGDIKTVLRTMFRASEFWAPDAYRAKVKTPLEFVASAARASGLEVNNALALAQSLDKLGMPLYGMQTPNGYSWKQEEWVSTGALVSRMNFALAMSADRLPGTRTEWTALLGEDRAGATTVVFSASADPESAAAKEKRLETMLLGEPVSERTRATVLAQSTDATVSEQAATAFDLRGANKRYLGGGYNRPSASAEADDSQAAIMAGLLMGSPEFQRR